MIVNLVEKTARILPPDGFGEETAARAGELDRPQPLSERPLEELLAVQGILEGDRPPGSRYSLSLVEGTLTLFERGDLAETNVCGMTIEITKSALWRADIDVVRAEIERRL